MQDSTFFTADAHPARQLLSTALAAVGLPFDVTSRHPLCASIQQIASRVRAEFASDTQVFLKHVAELDKLIAERDSAVAQAAAAYRPLLQRLEKSDQADARSREAIDQFCVNPEMPAEIAGFLREHWQRVLRQVWLEHGDETPQWQENTLVIDNLLWSIRPKIELEERKQLARVLPQMLQVLAAGMQRVSLPDATRAEFLDTCFALQTAAMRGASRPPAVDDEVPASPEIAEPRPAASVHPSVSELKVGSQLLKIFDLAGGPRTPGAIASPRCVPATGLPSAWRMIKSSAGGSAVSTRAMASCCSPTPTGPLPCCFIHRSWTASSRTVRRASVPGFRCSTRQPNRPCSGRRGPSKCGKVERFALKSQFQRTNSGVSHGYQESPAARG